MKVDDIKENQDLVELIIRASLVENIENPRQKQLIELHFPYLYFDVFYVDNETLIAVWNGKSKASESVDEPVGHGIIKRQPYDLKGPVAYKDIKAIYDGFGGNEDFKKCTIQDDEKVYYTITDTMKKMVFEKFLHNKLSKLMQ